MIKCGKSKEFPSGNVSLIEGFMNRSRCGSKACICCISLTKKVIGDQLPAQEVYQEKEIIGQKGWLGVLSTVSITSNKYLLQFDID